MTAPLDIDAIEKRMTDAEPGPWRVGPFASEILKNSEKDGDMQLFDVRGWGYYTVLGLDRAEVVRKQTANADFVAHARADIPALVARLRELEAENAEIRAAWMPVVAHCGF